jgi:hypothetical protein
MLSEKDQIIIAQVAVKSAVEAGANPLEPGFNDVSAAIFEAILTLASEDVGAAPTSTSARPAQVQAAVDKIEQAFPGAQTITVGNSRMDRLWKSALLDEPDKWWDNRLDKRNPKAPDFKAKNTSDIVDDKGDPVALWVDSKSTPDWVATHLAQS